MPERLFHKSALQKTLSRIPIGLQAKNSLQNKLVALFAYAYLVIHSGGKEQLINNGFNSDEFLRR